MHLHSIMVVDDNQNMRVIYARILAQEGFEVFTAATGSECLDQLETICPDIILMDVVLPDWDGINLVRKIKEKQEFARCIIILLSSLMTDSDSRINGLNAGAVDYLIRPVPNKELVAKIKSLFKVSAFQESLTTYNVELDQRVYERTRELEASIKLLKENISERKQLEEQLRQSQKMEAIGLLAGGVAHDFNNILQVIMGYSNLLLIGTNLDKEQIEVTEQIIAASEKASHLTRGLLAFSRKQNLNLERVHLNDIVQNVQKFLGRIIGEDIQLKTNFSEMNLQVNVDISQIEQVLINLATNARDAMQKGGLLTIDTGLKEIEVEGSQLGINCEAGRYVFIAVSDTGIGMDIETRTKIFEPFFTTKEAGKGTGLGMAIIYGIVKQHNGCVNVYSEPGHGSTVRIYLPLAETDDVRGEEQTAPAPLPGGSETILVAEDDANVRHMQIAMLTTLGYQVIAAEDGEEAYEKFAANHDRIDMILMDIIMPKKNGMEVFAEIRKLRPDVKILFSSGYSDDFINNRGISTKEVELITKPAQPKELMRKIREVLDR